MIFTMMTLSLPSLLAVLATILVLWLKWSKNRTNYPPGPTPVPLLGNVFDLTTQELWLRVSKWAGIYGDVVYLHICGQSIVFLSSPEAAFDLMVKRGAVYSDKPSLVMIGELMGGNNMVAFAPYGPLMKAQRRLTNMALGPQAVPQYDPLVERQTHQFLRNILRNPTKYAECTRVYAGSLTLSVVYGYEPKGMDDEILRLAENCIDVLATEAASGGGVWPVDVIPALKFLPKWMPGSGFLHKAEEWKKMIEDSVDIPYNWMLNSMRMHTNSKSFCSTILEDPTKTKDEESIKTLKWTANSMYLASADTFISSITHLFLALMEHPEVIEKARKEIDSVIGPDRLPTFKDRASLPYVEAVMSEVWRWSCPVPLGLPHSLMEDDVYKDKRIPKGSIIFANIWEMSRNPELFPCPDEFDPERYMNIKDERLRKMMDPRLFVFGFGRRICPGKHLAETSIWLLIAYILATLDVTPPKGGVGNVEYPNPIFREPTRFGCNIAPRNEWAMRLIQEVEV